MKHMKNNEKDKQNIRKKNQKLKTRDNKITLGKEKGILKAAKEMTQQYK